VSKRTGPFLLLALMLMGALAGCVESGPTLPLGVSGEVKTFDGYTWRAPVATDAKGNLTQLPAWALDPAALPVAVERLVPGRGAEPNLGITSKGNLFVTSGDQVYKSSDKGLTFALTQEFTSPLAPQADDKFGTADPMLWVDTTTDRVFVNHMFPRLLCTYLAHSDDEGTTWTERHMACSTPVVDHQKIMTAPYGPDTNPATTPPAAARLYPNVLYLCLNKVLAVEDADILPEQRYGTWCTVSFDGGLTFAYDVEAIPPDPGCAGINGHPAIYPDGTVVVAAGGFGAACSRPPTIAVTRDNGLTWDLRRCGGDIGQVEIDADITVTPDGTAYMLFRGYDQRAYLMRTTDVFRTCDIFPVAPPDHTMNVFAGITSGDNGRIAMAYLGTRDAQRKGADPSNATGGTIWHLFITTSLNAADASPVFVTQQVTPQEDPIQVGCIWLKGGGGGPTSCRNLLDFIDMVRDADGRVFVAVTDGCVPRNGCTGDTDAAVFQSRDRQVAVAVQDRGVSLLAAKGNLPSLGLTPPEPLPRS
jgi:Arc/MetJ family transcription regulator